MLFNSYEFIFLFLPIVFIGFFLLARAGHMLAASWLGLASLFFYGWWRIEALPLLLLSICLNYWFGLKISPAAGEAATDSRSRHTYLIIAVCINLAVLGYFKYVNFFVDNANAALGFWNLPAISFVEVLLPIGISFYTFTQIAFLVDCWQGKVHERSFIHYLLFVTYFPHLVAGPVLHHANMMPQFALAETYRPRKSHIAAGLTIFTLGLAKKLLIADSLGVHADLVFGATANGTMPMLFMAWLGVLAYTFQIYFDFSGYSDMAIGISLLFGITLPVNFNSPYRATSIIEFWRRWHISLSTFLRDYLYIPLGGNRHGRWRRYLNLFVTMLLGGLWHGASWTFVFWGAAHGLLLIVNHGLQRIMGPPTAQRGRFVAVIGWGVTFLCVCATWVLFRAENLTVAYHMYRGMLGLNGVSLPFGLAAALKPYLPSVLGGGLFQGFAIEYAGLFGTLAVAFVLALFAPNLNRLSRDPSFRIGPPALIAVVLALLFLWALGTMQKASPFLYFQF